MGQVLKGVHCYNANMENILLYLVLVPVGYLTGMLVNFISDWFYIRREFLPEDFVTELSEKGWLSYLFLPFLYKSNESRFKWRAILVNLIFVVLLPALVLYSPDRIEVWWAYPVLACQRDRRGAGFLSTLGAKRVQGQSIVGWQDGKGLRYTADHTWPRSQKPPCMESG